MLLYDRGDKNGRIVAHQFYSAYWERRAFPASGIFVSGVGDYRLGWGRAAQVAAVFSSAVELLRAEFLMKYGLARMLTAA
jgi:hypothetical protein